MEIVKKQKLEEIEGAEELKSVLGSMTGRKGATLGAMWDRWSRSLEADYCSG